MGEIRRVGDFFFLVVVGGGDGEGGKKREVKGDIWREWVKEG